jgi:hypothetical protein
MAVGHPVSLYNFVTAMQGVQLLAPEGLRVNITACKQSHLVACGSKQGGFIEHVRWEVQGPGAA